MICGAHRYMRRVRGRTRGWPKVKAFVEPERLMAARTLYENQQTSVATICQMFKISRPTFYRYVRRPQDAAEP